MAEVVVLTWYLYAVFNNVSLEDARTDLIERRFNVKVRQFLSKFSWFTQLNHRIHQQDYHKRNHRKYDVDDLIYTFNRHGTEEEEDADPNWFCLRKLKNALALALAQAQAQTSDNEDCRTGLLQWVKNFVDNCTENPVDYTIQVPRQNYNLELDNHDIMLFSWIVEICKEDRELLRLQERQRRVEVMMSMSMAEDN